MYLAPSTPLYMLVIASATEMLYESPLFVYSCALFPMIACLVRGLSRHWIQVVLNAYVYIPFQCQ